MLYLYIHSARFIPPGTILYWFSNCLRTRNMKYDANFSRFQRTFQIVELDTL